MKNNQGIKSEFGKVHKLSKEVLFQKICAEHKYSRFSSRSFTNRSWRSDTLLNRKKCSQLIQNVKIFGRSKWPKDTDPCVGIMQVPELPNEALYGSVIQFTYSMNTLTAGIVTNLLINSSHLQQLSVHCQYRLLNVSCRSLPWTLTHSLLEALRFLKIGCCFDVHIFSWLCNTWI
jgi:hypothetical protein